MDSSVPKPHAPNTAELLQERRRALGMSYAALSRISGVPVATVERILSDRPHRASLRDTSLLAQALGFTLSFETSEDPENIKRRRAHEKAQRLVELVQGTSLLEAQGVQRKELDRLVKQAADALLSGSPRQLWGDA